MKISPLHLLTLSLILLDSQDSAADDVPVPITIRAISLPPDFYANLRLDGQQGAALDAATVQRLDGAIQQGRAKLVGQWQKSLKNGQKEAFGKVKRIQSDGEQHDLGFQGSIGPLVKSGNMHGYLAELLVIWNEPGSLDGPQFVPGGTLIRRDKRLGTSVICAVGKSYLLGVLPASPTDGNRNLLIDILSVGGNTFPVAADRTAAGNSRLSAEVFAFPPGTTVQPDVATLQRMRADAKAKVDEIKLLGTGGVRCTASSTTLTHYFTRPASNQVCTEYRDLGLKIEMTPRAGATHFTVNYSTLLAPYTSADYKMAAADTGVNSTQEVFYQKHHPHMIAVIAEGDVSSTGAEMVVPLKLQTDYHREDDANRASVYFALVSCIGPGPNDGVIK